MKAAKVYRVRCGSPCYVRKVGNISNGVGPWFAYQTTHTSTFENYEEQRGKRFIFREGDYEVQINARYIDIT